MLPPEPATQQRAVAALFLSLLSLFGLLGLNNYQRGKYVVGFTLLVAALAIWFAVTSISRAKRSGTRSPRASVTAIVIGVIGLLVSCSLLAGIVVFGKQMTTYSQCISGANTNTARLACEKQLSRAIQSKFPGR